MSKRAYDISLLVGLLLIGAGVGCWSIPAALTTLGSLIIALTVTGAYLFAKRG